ncbi:MAG: enoyl-CoA hydratase/isomerase family protein [Bacillota bacterium]
MEYKQLIYEKKDWMGKITLNRPDKMNALNDELCYEFEIALEEAERDEDIKVVVITGSGRAFCAGYDLEEMGTLPGKARSAGKYPTEPPLGTQRLVGEMIKGDLRRLGWYEKLWNFSKPTIAQINGHALSGGCYLQLLCDLAISSENAKFGHPAQRMGGVSGLAALWVMVLGVRKTKELFYTGKLISAKEAEEMGLVNKVVPADQLEAEVYKLAEEMIAIPPDGLALNKQAIHTVLDIMGLSSSLRFLTHAHAMSHFISKPEGFKYVPPGKQPKS